MSPENPERQQVTNWWTTSCVAHTEVFFFFFLDVLFFTLNWLLTFKNQDLLKCGISRNKAPYFQHSNNSSPQQTGNACSCCSRFLTHHILSQGSYFTHSPRWLHLVHEFVPLPWRMIEHSGLHLFHFLIQADSFAVHKPLQSSPMYHYFKMRALKPSSHKLVFHTLFKHTIKSLETRLEIKIVNIWGSGEKNHHYNELLLHYVSSSKIIQISEIKADT